MSQSSRSGLAGLKSAQLVGISKRLQSLQSSQQNRFKGKHRTATTTRSEGASIPGSSGSNRRNEEVIEIGDRILGSSSEYSGSMSHQINNNGGNIIELQMQNEALTRDNENLKRELEKSKETAQKIFQESQKMRKDSLALREAKAESSLYKDQVETLRGVLDTQSRDHQAELNALMAELERATVDQAQSSSVTRGRSANKRGRLSDLRDDDDMNSIRTPQIRNQAIAERLKEVEGENLELRRRLVGLTPKITPGRHNPSRKRRQGQTSGRKGEEEVELEKTISCEGCSQLKKQKTRQADYFEGKLLEARQAAAHNKESCKDLAEEIECLKEVIDRLQHIFSKKVEKLEERVGLYKHRSRRLENYNSAHLKGIQTDVSQIKKQVGTMEKEIVKSQLEAIDREQNEMINEELGRLVVRSRGAENKLRALQRSLGILEAIKI